MCLTSSGLSVELGSRTPNTCSYASGIGTDRARNPGHEPGQSGARAGTKRREIPEGAPSPYVGPLPATERGRRAFWPFAMFCPGSCPVAGALCPDSTPTFSGAGDLLSRLRKGKAKGVRVHTVVYVVVAVEASARSFIAAITAAHTFLLAPLRC